MVKLETWRTEFVKRKIDVASNLYAGCCGGSYSDAMMILCAAISAIAAEIWTGRGIDRFRFVQLLFDFAPNDLYVTRISIPNLERKYREENRTANAAAIRNEFLSQFNPSQILQGDDVDRTENEVLRICPCLELKELRKHSYANLLYTEIRSSYMHEYGPGHGADSWHMTKRQTATISYNNWGILQDPMSEPERHIHYHFDWVSRLLLGVARNVDAKGDCLPNRPDHWWVEGKT